MRGLCDHRPIHNARKPVPYSLFSIPCFSSPFHRSFSLKSTYPHPPYLWKSFFDLFIPCNLQIINNIHFCSVDESVTANPRFCPFFGPKRGLFAPKWPLFRQFCRARTERGCASLFAHLALRLRQFSLEVSRGSSPDGMGCTSGRTFARAGLCRSAKTMCDCR
jgi:hypothetical protein